MVAGVALAVDHSSLHWVVVEEVVQARQRRAPMELAVRKTVEEVEVLVAHQWKYEYSCLESFEAEVVEERWRRTPEVSLAAEEGVRQRFVLVEQVGQTGHAYRQMAVALQIARKVMVSPPPMASWVVEEVEAGPTCCCSQLSAL